MKSGQKRTFLLVPGAQKSGTTWLYQMLHKHPAIALPTKEAHVFDRAFVPDLAGLLDDRRRERLAKFTGNLEAEPGRSTYWQSQIDLEHRLIAAESALDRYPKIFLDSLRGRRGAFITGDMTPDYSLLAPEHWQVVRRCCDRVASRQRVILLLRDPVARAVSELQFMIRKGILQPPTASSDDAWIQDFISSGVVVGHTRYDVMVSNLEREWAREDIHIEFYERLFTPEAVARIAGFLGVDAIAADFQRVANASPYVVDVPAEILRDLRSRLDDTYRWAEDRYGADAIRTMWPWAARYHPHVSRSAT